MNTNLNQHNLFDYNNTNYKNVEINQQNASNDYLSNIYHNNFPTNFGNEERSSTVLNCIFMLINQLNEYELETVKYEIYKKLKF